MNIKKAQAKRKEIHLAKLMRLTEKDGSETTMTRKEFVERLVRREGFVPYTWQENKIKDMSQKAFFQATHQQQDEHAHRQKEAGMKTCYGLRHSEDSLFYTVSKIEYDYALTLLPLEKAA